MLADRQNRACMLHGFYSGSGEYHYSNSRVIRIPDLSVSGQILGRLKGGEAMTEHSETLRRQAEVQQARATIRGREQAKRAQLRAELQHELEQPLTPGVKLSKRERETIAGRVVTGAIRQSVWPQSGVSGTHVAANL